MRGTIEGAFGGVAYAHGVDAEQPDSVVASEPATGEISYFDAETLESRPIDALGVDATLVGPIVVRGSGDDQQLLALTGPLPATDEHPATNGGIAVGDADGSNNRCSGDPCVLGLTPLPGAPVLIASQAVSGLVYVAGTAEDGNHEVWTIEPHMEVRGSGNIGMAAFDAARLDGAPLAMAFDSATTAQGDDHGRLLVSTADGSGGASIVDHRRGKQRVRLAPLRRGLRVGARRPRLPAGGDDVRPSPDRGARRRLRGARSDELRDEPDQHERHLRGDVHRRRVPRLLAGLVRPMGAKRVVGPAARRRPDRPGGGEQVGRLLRARRPARARPGSVRARAAAARDPRGIRARPRRDRRSVAVPRRHARAAGARAGDQLGAADPARHRREHRRAGRERDGRHRHRSGLRARLSVGRGSRTGKRGRVRVRPARSRVPRRDGRCGS